MKSFFFLFLIKNKARVSKLKKRKRMVGQLLRLKECIIFRFFFFFFFYNLKKGL